jgi:hypothetical protein
MLRAQRARLATLALLVTALSAGAASARALPAAGQGWRIVATHHFGAARDLNGLSTAVALGSNDAWALGGTGFYGGGVPVAEHWNGIRWRAAALPSGLTDAITAASAPAANDIWAVSGVGGYVLHYDGSAWSVARRWHPAFFEEITGVTAFSPMDVWVFGPAGGWPGVGTWHLHGRTWTRVTAGAGREVATAGALSPRDMWALGDCGGPCFDVLHYNGTAWRRVTSQALRGVQFADILALSPADVWASGTIVSPSREVPWLVHRNGTVWTRVKVPWPVIPGGLAPDGRGGVWLIATGLPGDRSWAAHLSRTGQWRRYLLSGSSFAVSSLALIPGGSSLWGAGAMPAKTGANAAIWAYGRVG